MLNKKSIGVVANTNIRKSFISRRIKSVFPAMPDQILAIMEIYANILKNNFVQTNMQC